jgi:hypothetical protein
MKTARIWVFLGVVMLALLGCASANGEPPVVIGEARVQNTEEVAVAEVESVSTATPDGEGWMVTLIGVRQDEIWQSDLAAWKERPDLYQVVELEKKGETNLYGGIALSGVVAMVDDADGGMPYVFEGELWNEGYDITLTAADGYSFTFSTAEVAADEILLVDMVDGVPVVPQIAGNLSSGGWVRDLSEIELSLAPVSLSTNDFELLLDINGQITPYTIGELETMSLYVEDTGSYTNSYGQTFSAVWGGVKLIPLLERYLALTPDSSITLIAMDGYEMSYGGDMLLDQTDGDWILAFKENGEYMPEDPGYIRLVKVGPGNPNITGHLSARMIKSVAVEGIPFEDFEITIVDGDSVEVFDRQTLQSGVGANRDRVAYYDRRAEADIPYMGIAVWRLVERPDGYSAITIEASDGFSVTLDNSQMEGNDDVILAMYTGADDQLLGSDEWPLRLVWDKDAAVLPEGIKSVRNVVRVILVY